MDNYNKNMKFTIKNMNNNLDVVLPKLNKQTKLNPDFVTGLTDAEGSFSITKHKDKRAKHGVNVGLSFRITMLSNEIELLKMVKDFF